MQRGAFERPRSVLHCVAVCRVRVHERRVAAAAAIPLLVVIGGRQSDVNALHVADRGCSAPPPFELPFVCLFCLFVCSFFNSNTLFALQPVFKRIVMFAVLPVDQTRTR